MSALFHPRKFIFPALFFDFTDTLEAVEAEGLLVVLPIGGIAVVVARLTFYDRHGLPIYSIGKVLSPT
jgi:hypothetical protein